MPSRGHQSLAPGRFLYEGNEAIRCLHTPTGTQVSPFLLLLGLEFQMCLCCISVYALLGIRRDRKKCVCDEVLCFFSLLYIFFFSFRGMLYCSLWCMRVYVSVSGCNVPCVIDLCRGNTCRGKIMVYLFFYLHFVYGYQ